MDCSINGILNNNEKIEDRYKYKVKWDRMDMLYSFIGIYQIGMYVYYPKKYTRTDYKIKRVDTGGYFGRKYLIENERYKNFKALNDIINSSGLLNVYGSIGNVIPIWPGGNVDKGKYSHCLDIPEIYFTKYLNWVDALNKIYSNAYMDDIINNKFCVDTKEFLDMMNKDTYMEYLKHIVSVIKEREHKLIIDMNRRN